MFKLSIGLLLTASLMGQNTGPQAQYTIQGTSLPDSCSGTIVFYNTSTGVYYDCNAGSYVARNPSSGSPWVRSGSNISPSNPGDTVTIRSALLGNIGGNYYWFGPGTNGAKCDDITDDTPALNTILAKPNGGVIHVVGTCLVNSASLVVPNTGGSFPTQPTWIIEGDGPSANGYWQSLPVSPSALDLRYNAPVAKIIMEGAGWVAFRNLTLKDGGADCATFALVTNTSSLWQNMAISGTAAGKSACNRGIVFGGTTTSIGSSATSAFQGYHSTVQSVFFDQVTEGIYGQTFANGVTVDHCTFSKTSGNSSATAAITAATNANPAVLTSAYHGIGVGSTVSMILSGFTGSWAALNGTHTVTGVAANTFSVAIDSTSFGAMAGSPVYQNGAAIVVDGIAATGTYDVGWQIGPNIFELGYYPYGIKFINAIYNKVSGNGFYDSGAGTLAAIRQDVNGISSYNDINDLFTDGTILVLSSAGPDPVNHSWFTSPRPSAGSSMENVARLGLLDTSPGKNTQFYIQCGTIQGSSPFIIYKSDGSLQLHADCTGGFYPKKILTDQYTTAGGVAGSIIFSVVLTTTAAASDVLTISGATSSSHCFLTPTNTSAAANSATAYVSAVGTNSVTVAHAATGGMTYNVGCTSN